MPGPDDLDRLRSDWNQLMERFKVDQLEAAPTWQILVAAYTARDRFYHNLEHLDEVFRAVKQITSITDDLSAVQVAVWFHDAVYDSRSKENENRSAELAEMLLSPLCFPKTVIERIMLLIRATCHMSENLPADDRETRILLDADLAILGASQERYQRYAAAIRLEYAWVSESEYKSGRGKVLEQFLSRSRIYRTDPAHSAWDSQARFNLQWERESLAKSR